MSELKLYKLQWPISSNDPEPKILVYSKGRADMVFLPVTKELKLLFNGQLKVYVYGFRYDSGNLVLETEPQPTPDW